MAFLLWSGAASAQSTASDAPPSPATNAPVGQAAGAEVVSGAAKCDADCVRKNMDIASHACARPIENQAPIDYEWMDRPFTGLFQEADPSDDKTAVVIYRGDSIRFQTADKAWLRVTYECAFDVDARKVVLVRARPGRINQPAQIASAPPAKRSGGNSTAARGSPQKVNGEALAAAISQAVRNRQQPAPKLSKTVKFGETSPIEVKQIEAGQTP